MKDFKIIIDTQTDLPDYIAKENDLIVIPLTFYFSDNVIHHGYLDRREMSCKEFYDRLRNGEVSKTTQVNSELYKEYLLKAYEEDKDALVICFSSGLSGSFNSLKIAQKELEEEYPDFKIKCVDSLSASMGEGLLACYAIEAKKSGMDLEQIYLYLEKKKYQISHWFTVDDIETLRRGGRVGNTAAMFAKALHIKPILYIDDNGCLVPRMKKMGRGQAIFELFNQFSSRMLPNENETIMISHADCLDDALKLKELVMSQFSSVKNVIINDIGPVIGSHTGPGCLTIFFVSEQR